MTEFRPTRRQRLGLLRWALRSRRTAIRQHLFQPPSRRRLIWQWIKAGRKPLTNTAPTSDNEDRGEAL